MGIAPAIVLYAVVWFLTIFVVLPFRAVSQAEAGAVVPGTHAGAPANFRVRSTLLIVTAIATAIWLGLVLVIVYGGLTVRDIDLFHRMGPPAG
jgi:predicted secreted protein